MCACKLINSTINLVRLEASLTNYEYNHVTLEIFHPLTTYAQRRTVNVNFFDNNIHHDGFLKMYKPSLNS